MSLFDKKYQVFISSTYNDLVKARDEVIKVLLKSYQIPIGMEMFSADNEEQWQTIETTIDNSDYYVLLIGHRYGSLTKEGISYTEKEFDYAKSIGVPIYAFVRERDVSTLPGERDDDPKMSKKLDHFIKKVRSNAICDSWTDIGGLGATVSIALNKAFRKNPRIGWVRADQAASPQVLEELAFLNKENRELRETISKLSQGNNSRPDFKVLLNGTNTLEFQIREKVTQDYNFALPYDIAHTENEIEKKQAETYNYYIAKHPEIAKNFNKEVNKYYRMSEAIDLDINLANIGNAKATNIYIDICFPEGIAVMKNSETRRSVRPNWPKELVKHPLKIRAEKLQSNAAIPEFIFDNYNVDNIISSIDRVTKDYTVKLKNNVVTIKLNNMLHTRNFVYEEELKIVALEIGSYTIDISIICEELQEPQRISMPVIVTAE